jgi:beta-glucosidase
LDVENPEPLIFGEKLIKAVNDGHIEPQVIDQACRRILRVIYRFACAEDPLPTYTPEMVAQPAHIAVALEAAEKSAVLLSNDGSLPLDRTRINKLAVLGKLAAMKNTGDNGSSRVRPPYVVTALEGLTRALGADAILIGDEDDLDSARAAASEADAVVIVVGNTLQDEGEFIPGDIALGQVDIPDEAKELADVREARPNAIGGDRTDLDLRSDQIALIEAATTAGKPSIVVIISGSAIMVEGWHEKASAILQTFYSGMEGGTALAKLLFGDVSPSGKLPFTVARSEADYPFFDRDADVIEYGYYHGYSLMDHGQREPRFAFGHGLSYAKFTYRALKARRAQNAIAVSVAVSNDGTMTADEVVQAYVGFPGIAAERPKKLLKGFRRVSLAPGETMIVEMVSPLDDLTWRDPATHSWRLESGHYAIMAGGNSTNLISTRILV